MFVSRLKLLALFVLVAGFFCFLLIGFHAVFAADRTSTTTTPTCRDTDGGEDIYVKGTLSVYTPTYGNQTVVEACADTRTIDELVCLTGDPTYAYTHKKTACGSGCKDGACLKSKTCSETDRGNNKMLKGANTISYEDGTVYTTGSDYCYDKNTVAEFTCNGAQWDITYESCGDGYTCDLGACKAVVVETPVVRPVVVTPVVRYDATAKSTFMAPSDGAILTNYPREAELQWTPITSASKYEIGVEISWSTGWETVDSLTSRSVYVVTPALTGDNQFRARVRALYPDNTYSQWSDYLYFSYKTAPTLTTPPTPNPIETQPTATEPATTQPATTQPATTETVVQTAEQTSEETAVEEEQPVVETKPTVMPKVTERKVTRMSCGNSAGGDGLYSACVKDTIKLDNKINITVRTYSGNYAWLAIKGAKKAYYRVKLGDSIDVVSKKGVDTISITYIKKSPKFGVFLQIETAE